VPFEPGRLIANGRSADIFEFGDGKVLRRRRSVDIPAQEPVVMAAVRAAGYPAPEVFEVEATDMVLQRIVGVDMLKVLERRPWRARRFGAMLADLNLRLAAIEPDPELVASGVVPIGFGAPEVFVHGDLHPMNVLLTNAGPVVIDWEGAKLGPRDADVAITWLLIEIGEPDHVPRLVRPLVGLIRSQLLRAFLAAVPTPTPSTVRAVCDSRLTDHNMKPLELERIEQFRERHG
jgi:aminoglycoside phosphotransferase (APT) family kinase protein